MPDDFLAFIASIFGVDAANISLETRYNSIPEWDSLMQLRLIAEVEEHYSVSIPIDEVPDIETLNDLAAIVERG